VLALVGVLGPDLVNLVLIALGYQAVPLFKATLCSIVLMATPLWFIGKLHWQRRYPGLPLFSRTKDVVFWHLNNYPVGEIDVAQRLFKVQSVIKNPNAIRADVYQAIHLFVDHEANRLGVRSKHSPEKSALARLQ
tara:strand:+ start:3432 stop:3836 length:405 start_codon:yes stop_codon:yes gene_type:complete